MLLYYCGTVSTKRNTRDFARCRCTACVVPSAFPFFGWFAIHLRSTEKLTLGQPKEGNTPPPPKHLSDAPQYLSNRSPAPQSSCDNRSRCFALYSVPSMRASPLIQNLRAARSAARCGRRCYIMAILHYSIFPFSLNVSPASLSAHSRGVAESSVASDNPRTPRVTWLIHGSLLRLDQNDGIIRTAYCVVVVAPYWSRPSHEIDSLADAASRRTGSG